MKTINNNMYIELSLIYLPQGEFSVYLLLLVKLRVMVNLAFVMCLLSNYLALIPSKKHLNQDILTLI